MWLFDQLRPIWAKLSDQALVGLCHLSLIREHYKYPLGVRVLITFSEKAIFHLQRYRESQSFLFHITHPLECQYRDRSHQGGRFWVYETSGYIKLLLTARN